MVTEALDLRALCEAKIDINGLIEKRQLIAGFKIAGSGHLGMILRNERGVLEIYRSAGANSHIVWNGPISVNSVEEMITGAANSRLFIAEIGEVVMYDSDTISRFAMGQTFNNGEQHQFDPQLGLEMTLMVEEGRGHRGQDEYYNEEEDGDDYNEDGNQ